MDGEYRRIQAGNDGCHCSKAERSRYRPEYVSHRSVFDVSCTYCNLETSKRVNNSVSGIATVKFHAERSSRKWPLDCVHSHDFTVVLELFLDDNTDAIDIELLDWAAVVSFHQDLSLEDHRRRNHILSSEVI